MKVVVFDFDGTLTKSKKGSNCWFKVWQAVDDTAYDDFLFGKYRRNEIDQKEWFDLIVERWKEKNVSQEILKGISKSIELLDGAQETLEKLHQSGIKIFVLSGGIRQIIEPVLKRERIDKFITSVETYDLIFDENNKLVGYNSPAHNPDVKNEYVEVIKTKFNLKGEDILFVGNGENDEDVYKSGAVTLCINPDDADFKNKTVWTHYIEHCNNLAEILPFIRTNCEKKEKVCQQQKNIKNMS